MMQLGRLRHQELAARLFAEDLPAPADRLSTEAYLHLRCWILANDPDAARIHSWSNTSIAMPVSADDAAREVIWIILCAGRSAQAARTIERKVHGAIASGRPVVEVFGYRAKAEAIEKAWRERVQNYRVLLELASAGGAALVDWCGSLDFVGDDTKFQLAKNFGADVCKPDIWLCRLAGIADRPRRKVQWRFAACMKLCEALAETSGDRIAAVDSLLWLACNKGYLAVDSSGGPVSIRLEPSPRRSIYR